MQTHTPVEHSRVLKEIAQDVDAIAMLSADHERVEDLLQQVMASKDRDLQHDLAKTLCRELSIHMAIEEDLLYPAARAALGCQDLIDEAMVEHASCRELLHQIEHGKPEDDLWSAKVKVLSEYLEHHLEEEHTEFFPQIVSSHIDLLALGRQMQMRRQEWASHEALPL